MKYKELTCGKSVAFLQDFCSYMHAHPEKCGQVAVHLPDLPDHGKVVACSKKGPH
jgi:hypothetical protein